MHKLNAQVPMSRHTTELVQLLNMLAIYLVCGLKNYTAISSVLDESTGIQDVPQLVSMYL